MELDRVGVHCAVSVVCSVKNKVVEEYRRCNNIIEECNQIIGELVL